jgi:hypothetical protein
VVLFSKYFKTQILPVEKRLACDAKLPELSDKERGEVQALIDECVGAGGYTALLKERLSRSMDRRGRKPAVSVPGQQDGMQSRMGPDD